MQPATLLEVSQAIDPAGLAQQVLDAASRADLRIVVVECFTGGAIAALLGNCDQYRRQFVGGCQFNCPRAMQAALGSTYAGGTSFDGDLALFAARIALRQTRAGIAFAMVGSTSDPRDGRVSCGIVDKCDHHWQESFCAPHHTPLEAAVFGLDMLARCIRESDARHY